MDLSWKNIAASIPSLYFDKIRSPCHCHEIVANSFACGSLTVVSLFSKVRPNSFAFGSSLYGFTVC